MPQVVAHVIFFICMDVIDRKQFTFVFDVFWPIHGKFVQKYIYFPVFLPYSDSILDFMKEIIIVLYFDILRSLCKCMWIIFAFAYVVNVYRNVYRRLPSLSLLIRMINIFIAYT